MIEGGGWSVGQGGRGSRKETTMHQFIQISFSLAKNFGIFRFFLFNCQSRFFFNLRHTSIPTYTRFWVSNISKIYYFLLWKFTGNFVSNFLGVSLRAVRTKCKKHSCKRQLFYNFSKRGQNLSKGVNIISESAVDLTISTVMLKILLKEWEVYFTLFYRKKKNLMEDTKIFFPKIARLIRSAYLI